MMVCLLTHICVTRPQWVNGARSSAGTVMANFWFCIYSTSRPSKNIGWKGFGWVKNRGGVGGWLSWGWGVGEDGMGEGWGGCPHFYDTLSCEVVNGMLVLGCAHCAPLMWQSSPGRCLTELSPARLLHSLSLVVVCAGRLGKSHQFSPQWGLRSAIVWCHSVLSLML